MFLLFAYPIFTLKGLQLPSDENVNVFKSETRRMKGKVQRAQVTHAKNAANCCPKVYAHIMIRESGKNGASA